jgi:hypothetical protein
VLLDLFGIEVREPRARKRRRRYYDARQNRIKCRARAEQRAAKNGKMLAAYVPMHERKATQAHPCCKHCGETNPAKFPKRKNRLGEYVLNVGTCTQCKRRLYDEPSRKRKCEPKRIARQAKWARIAAERARIAAERAAQRTAQKAAAIKAKPWSAPGLTDAQRFRLQYKLDPEFNLKQRLRAFERRAKRDRYGKKIGDLMRSALAHNGRSSIIEATCGYTIKQLRQHLERQFTRGMTWEAFCAGRIHIDHRVPLSSFDLSNEQEWRRAWALTNLQPLWAKRNQTKADKRELLL